MAGDDAPMTRDDEPTAGAILQVAVALPLLAGAAWVALRALYTLDGTVGRLPAPYAEAEGATPAAAPEAVAWAALGFAVLLVVLAVWVGAVRGAGRAWAWLAAALGALALLGGVPMLALVGYRVDWVALALASAALLMLVLPGCRGHYLRAQVGQHR